MHSLKKSLVFSKKSLVAIAALPQWPVRPWKRYQKAGNESVRNRKMPG
jgi:hypothetical protein